MKIHDTNVYEYLQTVSTRSPETLEALYDNGCATRCVFESLPPLAKQYVMRLVPCGDIWVELDAWLAEGGALAHHRVACTQLTKLRVMEKRKAVANGAGEGSRLEYKLHSRFRVQMMEWLCGSAAGQWERGAATPAPADPAQGGKPDELAPGVGTLESQAALKWEAVLTYLLSGGKPDASMEGVAEILRELGVMKTEMDEGFVVYTITADGYSFLLHDMKTQLWLFVRAYIEKATAAGATAELLIFLFQLSFLQLGEYYATAQLSPAQLQFEEDLASIG